MSVYNKTPMARRAARGYCRRCLAAVLCCVLVFCLTVRVTPRANAATVDGTSAVEILGGPNLTVIKGGASGGSAPASAGVTGSTFGAFLLAASGLNILADSIDYTTTRYYGGTAYEKGNELWSYLWDLGGDIGAWCMGVDSRAQDAGGIQPGDSYTIPAEVLEAVRQWAVSNMAFVDGVLPYNQYALQGDFGVVALSNVDFSALNNYSGSSVKEFGLPVLGAGTTFGLPALDYTADQSLSYAIGDGAYLSVDYTVTHNENTGKYTGLVSGKICGFSMAGGFFTRDSLLLLAEGVLSFIASSSRYSIAYNPVKNAYYGGMLGSDGIFWTKTNSKVAASEAPATISTLFTATPDFDEEKTEDIPITIPIELPTTQIDELTIPVITEISSTSLTEAGGEKDPSTNPQPGPGTGLSPGQITEAISNALPETGSQLGDNVMNDTMGDPDGTKSAFITRFPFSIPWDIAKAIKLLAAPPVTPRWEFDFLGPMADLVGGFPGDTTIVVDFSEYAIVGQVTRWLSSVFFVYGLAAATKRYMWPS